MRTVTNKVKVQSNQSLLIILLKYKIKRYHLCTKLPAVSSTQLIPQNYDCAAKLNCAFDFFKTFCFRLSSLLEVSKIFSITNTEFLTVKSSCGPGSQQTSCFTRKYVHDRRQTQKCVESLWLSPLHVCHCCCPPQVLDTHIFHSFLRDRLNRKWDAFSRMEQNTRDHVNRCDVRKPEVQSAFQMK